MQFFLGEAFMNKPSEHNTVTSDQPAKPATGELTEQELDKVAAGVEQVLNIGSQSSGAGAGKVTFNPF
jgi:hypothetical protein